MTIRILKSKPATHEFTPIKIAIVTGLSDPRCCELSPVQLQFLGEMPAPDAWKVRRNFPFVQTDQTFRPVKIVSASFANVRQFAISHTSGYRRQAAVHWKAILESTDQLLLITGSCGAELLNTIATVDVKKAKIEVLALGPVSMRRPSQDVTTVQGSRDLVSKLFFPRVDHRVPSAGHMDYWYNDDVKEIARFWLSSKISELSVQEATSPSGE